MSTTPPNPTRITLEQLLALNDEIVALTCAGVPLERGLVELGRDLPGRLGRIAIEVGQRLEAGESLASVVSQTDSGFPAAYRAVLETGLRSGRLSAALEGMSGSLRRVTQMRRLVGASLIYPIILLAFAYFLFVWLLHAVVPTNLSLASDLDVRGGWLFVCLIRLSQSVPYWWPWPPLIAVALFFVLWLRGSQASFRSKGSWRIFPSVRRLYRIGRLAAFAELLKLLVENNVPLDEAVVLAAEGCGDRRLKRAAGEFAECIRRGDGEHAPEGFPPFLGWLITTSKQQASLQNSLGKMAESYHKQAQRLYNSVAVYLPIFLAVGIGVTAIAVLAISVLGPWYTALFELSKP